MWRTPDGNRVLTEVEWALFRAGLDVLRDFVEDDIRSNDTIVATGIRAFDDLTPEQKLALLADVAQALRDPKTPAPHHTAANEGATAAVIATLRMELDVELDAV